MIKKTRHAVARVSVITQSQDMWSDIAGWLSDDTTDVVRSDGLLCLRTEERPDVVVLDRVLLVDVNRVLWRLRKRWPTLSLIVVDAADDADVSRLLDSGADDAVTVASPALASRLHALTRRARTTNAGMRIVIGDIVFDRESSRVWSAGREVELTPTEGAFFDCLFWHSPGTVDVASLTEFVWGEEATPQRRSMVRVYIGYLRTKLRASRHVTIQNMRGIGYRLARR